MCPAKSTLLIFVARPMAKGRAGVALFIFLFPAHHLESCAVSRE
jgi:hypothetical protein